MNKKMFLTFLVVVLLGLNVGVNGLTIKTDGYNKGNWVRCTFERTGWVLDGTAYMIGGQYKWRNVEYYGINGKRISPDPFASELKADKNGNFVLNEGTDTISGNIKFYDKDGNYACTPGGWGNESLKGRETLTYNIKKLDRPEGGKIGEIELPIE